MNHFSRLVAATVTTGIVIFTPAAFAANGATGQRLALLAPSNPNSSQGYLGIDFRDIDSDRAVALKLKEPAGAEIITVDHDAPAGTAGLRIHDVILQMNGQPIQGTEQLRRMLRETPAGRNITLLISRDGQQQSITTQLADRATLEQNAWSQHTIIPDPDDDSTSAYTFTPTAPASHGFGSGFFGALTFGGPSIGVQLDVLGSQLADYFGVKDGQGLLVKHVAANSPASSAGLKAGDVVTKVNGQVMASVNDWAKAIRNNRGKQVQVTIFRNHKEQILNLQAGEAKHKGDLEYPALPDGTEFFFNDDARSQLATQLAQLQTQPALDPEELRDSINQSMANIDTQKLMEDAQQSLQGIDMEKLRQQMKEQSEKWQKQMQELQKNSQTFRIEPLY
jgi:serine protease Do